MTGCSVRAALSAGVKHHANFCGSVFSNAPKMALTFSMRPCYAHNLFPATRNFSSQAVTKNLRLMTPEDVNPKVDQKSLTVQRDKDRPLVVFLEWMAAHKSHVQKFTDLYLGSGYDVLVAPLTPVQLLFPTSGSQVVAAEVAQFLASNNHYSRILVHGFSIGGYVWGEVELQLSRDSSRYASVIERIHGQVWDSVVGLESIINGFPLAVFPKNVLLRTAFSKYLGLHLWLFRTIATKHYQTSSACFHDPPVKAPALVFASRADPICTFKEMMEVVDGWQEQNMKVVVKIWDDSPHVGHLRKHRKEYIFELNNFLKSLQLPTVHDNEADKLSSKL